MQVTHGVSPAAWTRDPAPHHPSVLGQGLPQGTLLALPKHRQSWMSSAASLLVERPRCWMQG